MIFLHTNDLHGKLTAAAAEVIAELRNDADFYFDGGDCVKAGNMAAPRSPEPVWSLLEACRCSASVPGNREFHISAAGFRAKLAGCVHPVVCANLKWNGDPRGLLLASADPAAVDPLLPEVVFEDVGVFGLMVPMVTARMAARHISAFVNTSPVDEAQACVQRLRGEGKTVICLSHLGASKDRDLAAKVDGIDIIFGGHSHDLLDPPIKVGSTWICQSGSYAHQVGRYRYEGGDLKAEFIPL